MRESSYDARGGPVLFPSPPLLLLDTYAGDSLRTRAPLSSSNLVARPVLAAGRGRRGNKIHRASFSWSRSPFRARWSPPCVYIYVCEGVCVSPAALLYSSSSWVAFGRVIFSVPTSGACECCTSVWTCDEWKNIFFGVYLCASKFQNWGDFFLGRDNGVMERLEYRLLL